MCYNNRGYFNLRLLRMKGRFMRTVGHLLKPILVLVFVLAFLLSAGCGSAAVPAEATQTPVVTPKPETVTIGVTENSVENAEAMPTPTPTAVPTPTPIPFSFYAPTVNMTYEELVGSTTDINAKARDLLKDGYPDPKTYYIIVDKQWQVVLVYKRIDDGTKFGKPDLTQPVRYMLCSTGNPDKEHGNETTSGTWQIQVPKERFWQFVNLEAAQYLTLIHSRTYFHSILYKTKGDLNTLVKDSYEKLGSKDSHACIRLTVPDSRWMFYNIGYGTTCEIRDGDASDETVAAIKKQLVLPPANNNKLKANDDLWTDNWRIEDVAHELAYKYEKPPIPDLGDDEPEAPDPGTGTGGDGGDGGDGGTTAVIPQITPDPGGSPTDSGGDGPVIVP